MLKCLNGLMAYYGVRLRITVFEAVTMKCLVSFCPVFSFLFSFLSLFLDLFLLRFFYSFFSFVLFLFECFYFINNVLFIYLYILSFSFSYLFSFYSFLFFL